MPIEKKTTSLWTRDFILLSLSTLFVFTAFYFLIPTLPMFITEVLKADHKYVGMLLAVYTITALLIRPFTGMAIDRYGRKWIYIISMLLFSLLFSGYIVAQTIFFLFLLRTIHGFAWGVVTTTGSTVAVDIIPAEKRGQGIGIFGLAMTLAMSIGPAIAMAICGDKNYTLTFSIATAIALIGLILANTIHYPKVPVNPNKKFIMNDLIDKKSLPTSLTMFIIMMNYGGILSFISIYAHEIGIKNAGLFFLIFALGIALARITSGKIFDRKGPKEVVIVGACTLIIGFPILAIFKNPIGFYSSALLLGIGNGIILPTFQAMVNNMAKGHRRGAANSTVFTALDLGIGFGMIITGFLSEKINLSGAFLLWSAVSLVGLIVFLTFVMKHYDRHKN